MLVLSNHRDGFPFRCRDKPVSICIFARSFRIVFPFCWCCSAAHFSNIFAATAVSRSAGCAFSPPRPVIRHRQNADIIPKTGTLRRLVRVSPDPLLRGFFRQVNRISKKSYELGFQLHTPKSNSPFSLAVVTSASSQRSANVPPPVL